MSSYGFMPDHEESEDLWLVKIGRLPGIRWSCTIVSQSRESQGQACDRVIMRDELQAAAAWTNFEKDENYVWGFVLKQKKKVAFPT